MSLKALEMQIALPRTHEAGKIHEQLQLRGQISQEHATQEVQREQEKKRSTVVKNESKASVMNNNQQTEKHKENNNQNSGKKNTEETEEWKHPYKGTKIDFSG